MLILFPEFCIGVHGLSEFFSSFFKGTDYLLSLFSFMALQGSLHSPDSGDQAIRGLGDICGFQQFLLGSFPGLGVLRLIHIQAFHGILLLGCLLFTIMGGYKVFPKRREPMAPALGGHGLWSRVLHGHRIKCKGLSWLPRLSCRSHPSIVGAGGR